MMAVVCILAMIAFILVPAFDLGRGRGSSDPVVAETTLYGDIHDSDIKRMRMARALANRFIIETVMQAGFSLQREPFGSDSEAAVVETMLLARKAEQLGMRVTDEDLTRFIRDDIAQGRVSAEQFNEILKKLGDKGRVGIPRQQVYDALRIERLAQRMASVLAYPQQVTPAQRWEAYERISNRADIEAVAVAVADFRDKFPEPHDTAIASYFAKYKDSEPIPGSPEPGFKVPAKVVLQYFKADYEQFDDPDSVTYGEIVEAYDKFKESRYLYSGDFGASPDEAAPSDTEKSEDDGKTPAASGDAKTSEEGAKCQAAGAAEGSEAGASDDASIAPAKKPAPKLMSIKDDLILPRDVIPPRFDPLWKVEPDIRADLARQKAVKRMDEVLDALRKRMLAYGSQWSRWEVKHEHDKTLPPPTPLDFDALAAENHLTAGTTPPVSMFELSKIDGLGMSFITNVNASLARYAFSTWPVYQPTIATDGEGNRYLVWKTELQAARVPEMAEIRDEVVLACKMIEARKLASERAKAIAEMARTEEASLSDLASREDLPLVKPAPFSWLTYGAASDFNYRMPPRQSEVQGIEDPGHEFMQTVFTQPSGGVAVAFNNPQTIAYVIKLAQFEPDAKVLHSGFLADDFRTYEAVMEPQFRQQMMAWGKSIQDEAGLKWVCPPDPRRPSGGDSEEGD